MEQSSTRSFRSPWIRVVELDGRNSDRMLWLTTGDVVSLFEAWPACLVPQRCALCHGAVTPFLSPAFPLRWNGRLAWYCDRCVVQHPALSTVVQAQAKDTYHEAWLARLYPRFDVTAPPGEEWR
jgi:hypothetical protein